MSFPQSLNSERSLQTPHRRRRQLLWTWQESDAQLGQLTYKPAAQARAIRQDLFHGWDSAPGLGRLLRQTPKGETWDENGTSFGPETCSLIGFGVSREPQGDHA